MSIHYTADQLQRKFRGATGSPGFSRLAEVLRTEGRLDEAIQTCLEGLRVRPNTLSGHVVLGKTYLDAGRVEESRDQFEAALRLDPRCLSAMHHLARIMTKMQWPDAAVGYYNSILEVEPWDAEIRALLSGASQGPTSPAAKEASAGPAPDFYGVPAVEDTFHKPEGFAGDVMEVNLNDMAADFLPGREDDASLGLAEESLEDALSASQEPMAHQTRIEATAPPERMVEPRPMDVLKDEPVPLSGMDGEAPPISGQDVEDRLDSLFGMEDAPSASLRDGTATWSPAPAESAATATGEMRASETGEMLLPAGSGTLQPTEIPGVQDFSAVDFERPLEQRVPAGAGAFADQDATVPEDRVHGEDIERRLDELFNLTEDDNRPPTETSTLPVAPGPKMGETVSLGEVVSFGGDVGIEEPLAAIASGKAAPLEDTVTGQDVADKLDILFGAENTAVLDTGSESAFPSTDAVSDPAAAFKEPAPWPRDVADSDQKPPSGVVMSTESMLPPGWFGQAEDGPGITGADVEAQLDKLFQIETDGETLSGGSPGTDSLASREAHPAPGDESDLTVTMPAMRSPIADQNPHADERPEQDFGAGDTLILPIEKSGSMQDFDPGLEDSFDTLAPEDSSLLSETTAIEMVDGEDVAGRLDELFADEVEPGDPTFGKSRAGSLSHEEMSLFTTESGESPELTGGEGTDSVTGEDVSSRLQQMFDAGDPPATALEAASPPESGVNAGSETGTAGSENGTAGSETDAVGSETDEDMVPLAGLAKPAASNASTAPAAPPELAPMSDEEDPYPDEDELAAQSGAGANVATVTLAEIYFQQGLREQALQIYRQLLEREPENDSVRKRIEEIEATKPDGGEPGPGSDPRRPRPGLKVPKRKK